jgi:hypothetical protein
MILQHACRVPLVICQGLVIVLSAPSIGCEREISKLLMSGLVNLLFLSVLNPLRCKGAQTLGELSEVNDLLIVWGRHTLWNWPGVCCG